LPPISRAVSTARKNRLEYDFPIGTAAPRNTSPTAFASARPLSFSWRCLATLSRFQGVGVGLIGMRGAMADDDHVSPGAK